MPGKRNLRMKAARAAVGLSQAGRGRYAPDHRPDRGGRLQPHAQFVRGDLQSATRYVERLVLGRRERRRP